MDTFADFGRYRILGEIGRGSSGTVYHALDTLIGREVAIKSFHPSRQALRPGSEHGERLRGDLLREARSAGMLSHPNVVALYDVAQGPDGTLFIAMEYVQGQSLADVLAESGPPDFERTVDWISQAAAALDYLHAMGLVHRDVKPANLLITEHGRVKLTDFGIALPLPGAAAAEEDEDAVLGTPGYMAPEQILGREISPRTDVWSLGAVLYEMLTGRRPFEGRSVAEVVHRVVHAPVPAPAESDEVPARLRELLERAMAKDARWRLASAGELAAELREILYQAAGEAGGELSGSGMLDRTLVTAPPPPAGPGWRRWALARRKPMAVALLAAALVLGSALAYRAAVARPELPAAGGSEAAEPGGRGPEARGREGEAPAGPERSAEAAAALSGGARVTVAFSSEAPEGVLTVYAGGEQLLRRGFSYYEPGWLFGRRPATGGFEEELRVPAGVSALWLYVAGPQGPARRLEAPGRFPPGSHRVLRVHLSADGEATAAWAREGS